MLVRDRPELKPEPYVQALLHERFGVELTKIAESSEFEGKTPDFEFLHNAGCAFVAELKTLEYHPPSKDRGWKIEESGSVTSAWREDNSVNRVAKWIHRSLKQLSTREEPKVLMLLNEDDLDVLDLEEAVSGFQIYTGAAGVAIKNTRSSYIAERIQHDASEIDLYIWIDRMREGTVQFRMMTEVGGRLVAEYFRQPQPGENV